MVRKGQKGNRRTDGATATISDSSTFRRSIHTLGDLGRGLSRFRQILNVESIPEIVRDLMRNPVYRNAFSTDALPKTYERVRTRRALIAAKPEIEIVWSAS